MFKITEIEISHNKRLRSGLIDRILYKPKSPYQIIVGPNGYGKSALLDECTAYPSSSGTFNKGGLSRLVIESDHGVIETKTLIGSDCKHEFWLNGENLNDGGTSTVQKDLVKKYLNVDKFSAIIQSGQFSFSQAGAAKRQEFLTLLGDADMSFANGVFQKARKKLSHATGAVNMLQESLVEKESKQISEEEYKTLTDRLSEYQQVVTEILKEYKETRQGFIDSSSIQYQWHAFPERIKQTHQQFPNAPLNASDRAVWVERQSDIKDHCLLLETRKKALQEEFDELEQILKRNADASEENIQRIREEINYWAGKLEARLTVPYYDKAFTIDETKLQQACNEIDAIFSEWKSTLAEMQPDPENLFTRKRYETLLEQRQRFQEHYNSLSAKHAQVTEQLQHLENGQEVHCPSCHFHFIPGVSADAKPRLLANQKELFESMEKGKVAIAENQQAIETLEVWFGHYRNLVGLMRMCPNAETFFVTVQEKVTLKDEPLRAVQVALLLREDLDKQLSVLEAKSKMHEAQLVLSKLTENAVSGIEGIKDRHARVKTQLHETYQTLLARQEELNIATVGLKLADQYSASVDNCIKDYQTLVGDTVQNIDDLFNQTRLLLIQDLQGHIGTLTKTLNDAKTVKDQIADTKLQLEKQKKRVEGFKLIVSSLSPKSGLVAEQMNEFIKIFIAQMNEVIAEVWSHPMELLVGKPNDSELSYEFPLRLHDSDDYIVPDIKDGSDGQMKIVDFAFQWVALLYLGLENIPLNLDEVDRPLSPDHKVALMKFLIRGIENERISQVFLVSHHAISHGALPFSDVVDFDFRAASEGSNVVAVFS